MVNPGICSEHEIERMVHGFYAQVRVDPVLGPIFNTHVHDWDHHLVKLVDFWSSALLGTARYRGTPMPKHAALPGLSAELFDRWLAVFRRNTATLGNSELQSRADSLAERIAQSLWDGYRLQRSSAVLPAAIGSARQHDRKADQCA